MTARRIYGQYVLLTESNRLTALKTLTLRLRGSKTELEEMGEDVTDMATTTSQLQAKLLALTGGQVDIMADANTFKNSTQILREMADAWQDMTDVQRASALELMGGKRQANVLSALIQNFDTVEEVIETSANSAGSALKENEKYLDSIQGKIDQFNNAMQAMWNSALNSDVIKFFIDLGTTIIKLIDDIGLAPIAMGAAITSLTTKFGGIDWAHPIKSFKELFSKEHAINIKTITDNISRLETELADAQAAFAETGSDSDNKRITEIQGRLDAYRSANKEALDLSKQLVSAEQRLDAAKQRMAREATPYSFQQYADAVRDAQAEVDELRQKQQITLSGGKTGWQKLGETVNDFSKQVQSAVAQMLVMMLISQVISWVVDAVQDVIETAEEAKETFDKLSSELSNTETELDGLEKQLEDINKKIEEINENTPLSFAEQEELTRLQAESAELQRQIDLMETLRKHQQQGVNASAVNAADKYRQTGVKTGKTAGENVGEKAGAGAGIGAGVGVATGIGGSILTAVGAGTTLGAWAGPVGMLIGAAIGAIAGAVIGAAVGGIQSASEEKIGESLDNMKSEYDKLQEEFNSARANYQKDASDKNKKKFEEAQEALQSYEANMSNYLLEMNAIYSEMDWETASTEQKQAMQEFYDMQDKWAIESGGKNAKQNAISRIFGDEASDELKNIKKRMEEAAEAGTEISLADAFNGDEEAYNAFKTRLYNIGLTVYETEQYFKDQKKAADEAINSIATYDAIKQIQKLTGGVNDLKNAFKELHEEGIVSADTLLGLEEKFGDVDGWKEFFEVVSSGTATMEEAQDAAKILAENYIDNILSSGALSQKEYITAISHLQSLGITNAKDFLDTKLKKNMATDIAQMVKNGTSESDAIKAVEKEYGIKLDGENDRLLVEKAITAEKAKQEAADKQAAKDAYDLAKYNYEAAIEKESTIDEKIQMMEGRRDETGSAVMAGFDKFTEEERLALGITEHPEYGSTYIYNGKNYSKGSVMQEVYKDLLNQKVEIPSLPVEVTEIDVQNANNVAAKAANDLQTELDKHGLTLEINLIDKNELIDEAQNIYDTLANAAKEYGESGYVSVDTLQSLLQLEPKYLALLYDENGQLNLNKDTMYKLTVARVTDMGIQQAQQVIETARTAVLDGNIEKLKELTEVTDGQATSNWDLVKSNLAILKTEMTDKGVDDSIYKGIEDQVFAIQNLTNTTIANIGNTISSSGNTAVAEVEDAFKALMDYWDNRISANQAKYDQIQNDIDFLEAQGKMADANYYKDQIALLTEGEESKEAFLEAKLQGAADRLRELEEAGKEGSDEWWEAAQIYNDTLSELDDVRDTVLDLQDAIGNLEWSKFEELNNRIDDTASKLETIRDLIAPNGEEDWFDDEGNWTEKGVASLAGAVQLLEYYKSGLNEASKALEAFQSKSYENNEDWFANAYGIHSEQEYYDYLQKLTDEQYKYASSVSDTEQDIAGMWESQVDAVEEYFGTLIESYNDYIDSVKEALDAERSLYDFKKNVQKQSKDIAALERRIASLSGSTNASDIAERRKLESELYESRESLNDTYYDHSKQSQQEALEAESVAYEETMNRFVENLRTNLDLALQDMDTFIQGVTSAVTVNAPTILDTYNSLGIALDSAIVDPWQSAIDAMGEDGYSGEEGLGLMNSWAAEGGVFSTFSTKATNYLTSVWDDSNVDPGNAFATAVSNKVSSIVSNIKQNVETAKGYLRDMYDVRDSSVYNPPSGGDGGSGGGGYVESIPSGSDVINLQKILNKFFSLRDGDITGEYDNATYVAVRGMQKKLGITVSGKFDSKTKTALEKYLNSQPVGSWFRSTGVYIPGAMYAKGTLGTTRDEFAITDESWIGEEITLAAGKNGQLQYLKKGSAVMPADISANLVEWGKINPSILNAGVAPNVNMISNAVNKPEFNFAFDALVKAENITEETLPAVKKLVTQELNRFTRELNYALKGKGAR